MTRSDIEDDSPESHAARWRGRIIAFLLGAVLALVALELAGRFVFRESPYNPGKKIRSIQANLVADPHLGYLWKPNVTERDDVLIEWRDAAPYLLTTDADGFLNTPEAIEARRRGAPVDVIGLGDSFVHNAYATFHDDFAAAGFAYYNLAMHRHSPPQYNRILERYGFALDPAWVLYGVTENDFVDVNDFHAWERSDLDWFEYHSGTWCGPPVSTHGKVSIAPGIYTAWRLAAAHTRRFMGDTGPDPREGAAKIAEYVISAHHAAEAHGSRFLVVLIPYKERTIRGDEPSPNAPDELRSLLDAAGIAVLDLRPIFLEQPDRKSLFYRKDGHWNSNGMRLAADAIQSRLAASEPPEAAITR